MDFLFFTIYVANEINRQRRLAFLWHWVVVQYSFSPLKKYIFTRLLISSKNCYCRRRNVVRSCLANGFCCVCLLSCRCIFLSFVCVDRSILLNMEILRFVSFFDGSILGRGQNLLYKKGFLMSTKRHRDKSFIWKVRSFF